jgi:hypothetical protein
MTDRVTPGRLSLEDVEVSRAGLPRGWRVVSWIGPSPHPAAFGTVVEVGDLVAAASALDFMAEHDAASVDVCTTSWVVPARLVPAARVAMLELMGGRQALALRLVATHYDLAAARRHLCRLLEEDA